MTVHYDLTEADLDATLRHWEQESAFLRKQRAKNTWLPLAVWIPLAAAYSALSGDFSALVIAAVVCLLWIPIAPWLFHRRFLGNTKRILRESPEGSFIGNHSLTLTPDSLIARSSGSEGKVAWSKVAGIQVQGERLFIDTGALHSFVIPRRAFEDEQSFLQFIEEARNLRERAVGRITDG